MDRSRFDRIMRELDSLRRMVTSRSSAPQLAYSSFDSGPGHGIDEVDPVTGQVVASYGTQYDGSHGVVQFVGPVPPMPSLPVLEGAPSVLSAAWDGTFAEGPLVVATLDWTHLEAHASQDQDYTAETADTIIGTINTARGGKVTAVVEPGTWYVRFVSRSAAGKRSDATAPVSIVITATTDTSAIEADIDAAVARLEKAEKKFTISNAIPSTTTGHANGDVWWRKDDTTQAVVGTWVMVDGEWQPRGMSIGQVVPGAGTISAGLVDLLFAEVVVAETLAATEAFIGGTAIMGGAVTAAKITASEELTAKVAQFLEVNADMINTNSLWADSAWIAAARTHILEVLQHTNGGGYTSTVTGQGLRVTYADTISGRTWDVIRLGTFGADYLGISDGTGRALASITGAGEVGSTSMYSDGPVFSRGRQVDVDQAPKGEVAYGTLSTATTSITAAGNGIFEISFEAEPGRVYKIDGATNLSAANTTAVTPGLRLSYTTNGTIPQVGSTTIPIQGTPVYPSTATTAATTFPFHARFIPVPMATAGTQAAFTKVRVLIAVTRVSGTGTAQAANTWMSVTDAGTARRDNVGVNNGTSGTSTFADYATVTETFPLLTPVGAPLIFSYQRNSDGTWPTLADGSTATGQMRVGVPVTGQPWKSLAYWGAAQYTSPFYKALRASQGVSLEIDSLRVNIKPTLFREGMGFIEFGFSNSAGWDPRGTPVPAWNGSVWARSTTVRVPAWGEGVPRSIEFPKTAYPWLLLPSAPIMFFMGMSLPDETLVDPQSGVSVNFEDISFTVTYRKKI